MARGSVRKRSFVKAGKRSSNGLLLGYARVSKGDDQTNIMQARALRATGCRRIFEKAASGRTGSGSTASALRPCHASSPPTACGNSRRP